MDTGPRASSDVAQPEAGLDRTLPGAIARSARDGSRLAEALTEPVEQALRLSARRNPEALVDALFGIVGHALARAAAERVRGWVMGLNHALLVGVSLHAWRWRAEAWRSGRRYADVVRDHTQARRIRHVFLIHRRTGLLLLSAARAGQPALDGDMVSAMLTAIQDFVQDSFAPAREDRLQSIRIGSSAVWIEQGRHAILAGVVDGEPTPEMRPVFAGALERIHVDFAGQLSSFSGDTAVFAPASLYLESCVNARFRAAGERLLPITWALLCLVPAGLALWGVLYLRGMIGWHAYVREISAQPGIVVIESGRRDGKYYIRGLHDPLALNPVSMLDAMGIPRQRVLAEWQPYQALIPELALLRARQMLRPPDTVALEINGTRLKVRGAAPREWIEEANRLARTVPGITAMEMADLTAPEARARQAWDRYIESLVGEPGVIVLSAGYRDGRPAIRGLRDPAAMDPARRMAEMGIATSDVDMAWETYDAGAPAFVLARARRILAPPSGVELSLDGATLVARGEAHNRWIRESEVLARAIGGVSSLRTDGLRNTEMAAIGVAVGELASLVFAFFDQGTDLQPGQARKMERLVARLADIDAIASSIHEPYTVEVRGHVSNGPDEDGNVELSAALARRFIDLLQHQNLDLHRCRPVAMGSAPPSGSGDGGGPRDPVPKRSITIGIVLPQ